jgi:phosphatidylglycerol lysyltransferase
MAYFDVPGVGYLAYIARSGVRFVLGDPVASPTRAAELVSAALAEHPDTCFVQVQKSTAELLKQFGLHATQMGIETRLDLTEWSVSGRKKQGIRSACNAARRKGIGIREADADAPDFSMVKAVSDSWLRTRKVGTREIIFLDRPLTSVVEAGVRRFFAFQDGHLIGVAYCDPVQADGALLGYMPNVRASKAFPQGLYYAFLAHVIDVFRAEGVKWLFLGASPLSSRVRVPIGRKSYFAMVLALLSRIGTPIYNFRGVEFTKSVFCGEELPVYTCTRSRFPLITAVRLFRLCNVI